MINLDVAEQVTKNGHHEMPVDQFLCKSGVILNMHKVKRQLVADAAIAVPEPKVPIWYNDEKGRDEENPLDPKYVAAQKKYSNDVGAAGIGIYLMFGTSVKFIPENTPKAEDAWDEDYSDVGVIIPTNKRPRYLAWLKYIALEDETEQFQCVTKVMEFSGIVTEEMVASIMATFRSDAES